MVLYVHLSEDAVRGEAGHHLARVTNTRTGVTAEQVRTWCANPDTQVTVKPVVDLNAHIQVNAYEVPQRLEEQTDLRDDTCTFPWCHRAAHRGGPRFRRTSTDRSAPDPAAPSPRRGLKAPVSLPGC